MKTIWDRLPVENNLRSSLIYKLIEFVFNYELSCFHTFPVGLPFRAAGATAYSKYSDNRAKSVLLSCSWDWPWTYWRRSRKVNTGFMFVLTGPGMIVKVLLLLLKPNSSGMNCSLSNKTRTSWNLINFLMKELIVGILKKKSQLVYKMFLHHQSKHL